MDEPWIWLCYSTCYALPWLWLPPTPQQIWGGLFAFVFLTSLYVLSYRTDGWRLFAASSGIMAIALAVMPLGDNWSALTIYAMAAAGRLRPPLHAMGAIALFFTIGVVAGVLSAHSPMWWLPSVMIGVLIGGAAMSRRALADKSAKLIAAREEVRQLTMIAERERIGRDLHDVLGRTLTLIAVKADLAARLIGTGNAEARTEVEQIAATARASFADVHGALVGIDQPALADEMLAARDVLVLAGLEADVRGDGRDIPMEQAAILAAVLREGVTNVVRHAHAGRCMVEVTESPTHVGVSIEDDGIGGVKEGFGLLGMRVRVEAAGGHLHVRSRWPGSVVTAAIPLHAPATMAPA